ncbi:hypothetical protein MKW92_002366, partial [Papaver armeniacum]
VEIKNLREERDELSTEKDDAVRRGAQALGHFQETVLLAKTERDRAISDNEALIARENMIRSRLRIDSDDDFEWDLSVVENARVGLATR